MNLENKITTITGVGGKTAKKLARLGIKTVNDLIHYFPRTWQDFSRPQAIRALRIGQEVIIKAKISNIENFRSPRKGVNITQATLEDEQKNQITALWFNQPFLLNNLRVGTTWLFSGKTNYDFGNKRIILSSPQYVKESRILPIYPETEGINSKYLRLIIKKSLGQIKLADWLPTEILSKERFFALDKALGQIHFPDNSLNLAQAKERLSFDELFLLSLKLQNRKKQLAKKKASQIATDNQLLINFVKSLPFKLTNAQRRVSWEIICDLAKNVPMNRLLNGDVGSGKTVVAAIVALNAIKAGFQVAWMAPTEILASQHFKNVCELLKPFGVKVALLTSNQAKISECKVQSAKCKIKNSELKDFILNSDLIIGTHALIQKDIKIKNLGLVIIDEQHRFGVKQRAKLATQTNADETQTHAEKISVSPRQSAKVVPHFLSMTATPIPRSLALSLYGDLDISFLDELPPARKKIITRIIDPTERKKAYYFIRQKIVEGRQVFVVCPLIETNNKQLTANNLFNLERKSVKKEYEKLSEEVFPEFNIGILHGKMKPEEKEKIMSSFVSGKTQILVSTSVVEVGIDVANAAVMMIEDAERFGLAQLHQFRGRVGRGKHKSYCFLFTNSLSEESKKRLLAMEKYQDGFKLAEADLKLRGPGDFIGDKQSGFFKLKIARLTDIISLKRARFWSTYILDKGLKQYPSLKQKINSANKVHLE